MQEVSLIFSAPFCQLNNNRPPALWGRVLVQPARSLLVFGVNHHKNVGGGGGGGGGGGSSRCGKNAISLQARIGRSDRETLLLRQGHTRDVLDSSRGTRWTVSPQNRPGRPT